MSVWLGSYQISTLLGYYFSFPCFPLSLFLSFHTHRDPFFLQHFSSSVFLPLSLFLSVSHTNTVRHQSFLFFLNPFLFLYTLRLSFYYLLLFLTLPLPYTNIDSLSFFLFLSHTLAPPVSWQTEWKH